MEPLIVEILKKYYPRNKDIENLLKYIVGKGKKAINGKLLYVNAKGLSRDNSRAAQQIIRMQSELGKNKERRCYQIIVSFPQSMDDKNVVIIIAEEIAEKIFENFQVYYGVHKDTKNLHVHFAINAVSYRNGKKWHMKTGELEYFKKVLLKVVNDNLENNGYKKLRIKESMLS